MLNTILEERLKKRHQENSFRKLISNSELIDFTSNDYLGLARSEKLFELIQNRIKELPHMNGATGSRLLSGNNPYTEQVEKKLAVLFKSEAVLIFNSGYNANQAVLSCIAQKGDTIIYDEYAHASIRDGARLSLANRYSFLHNDLSDLERKIIKSKGNVFIAVESIYSMDGDCCDLQGLTQLADKYKASIILDEAHSTGVTGPNGSGIAVSEKLEDKIAVRIYTFGKAMGIHGACIGGSKQLIDYLVNYARPFIYTTAPPIHSITAIDCAFEYLTEKIYLQDILQEKIDLFIQLSKGNSLPVVKSDTQIQAVMLKGNAEVKHAATYLQDKGFDVRPIMSPTVPKNMERLRICLHTYNTTQEITQLAHELSTLKMK